MYIEENNLELNEDWIRFEGEQKELQGICVLVLIIMNIHS